MTGSQEEAFVWLRRFVQGDAADVDFSDLEHAWETVRARSGDAPEAFVKRVAEAFNYPPLTGHPSDTSVTQLIEPALCERLWAVPVEVDPTRVKVATANPGDPDLVSQLEFRLGRRVGIEVTSPERINEMLREAASVDIDVESATWVRVDETDEDRGEQEALGLGTGGEGDGRILDRLIAEGARIGASDVHVQATGSRGLVRFRVDGVLRMGPELTLEEMAAVLGRAKAVGGMDPSVRLRPQDGRARMVVRGDDFDLRLSTIPASRSESLVVRILARADQLTLAGSGLDEFALERLRSGFMDQTAGIFTVTGPTGSGKTTLLYTLLAELNRPELAIHTVEDPIELFNPGLVQVQVNPRAGLDFTSALRSILRQDPEVILVGETRDLDTARMVTQAALTGHLVATTLHTIDSATTILRYRDLGVEASELAEALNGVSAQRLVRKLCEHCRIEVASADSSRERWFEDVAGRLPAFRAKGCERCDHTGYRGRAPIVEVLLVDAEMRAAILDHLPLEEIRAQAIRGGMRSMGDIAVDQVLSGVTDAEEVRRVLGADLLRGPADTSAPALSATSVDRSSPAALVDAAPRVSSGVESELALLISLTDDPEPVANALRTAGVLAYGAEDIPHAAVWAEIHHPDLVVLDVSDDVSGAVARVAEARDALEHLEFSPIVVLPADAAGAERVLLEHDFSDYLCAPVDPSEMTFLVRRVLHRRKVAEPGDEA